MTSNGQERIGPRLEIDRQLARLRAESRRERERLSRVGGALMIGAGLLIATIFLAAFYFSARGRFDYLMAGGAILVSVGLFGWGLKRLLDE